MIITILAITGFQLYWLKNNYDRERQNLEIKTNAAFTQTILKLQASKLRLGNFHLTTDSNRIPVAQVKNPKQFSFKRPTPAHEPKIISVLNLVQEKMRDSLRKDSSGRRGYMITLKDSIGQLIIDTNRRDRNANRSLIITKKTDSITHRYEEINVNNREGLKDMDVKVNYSNIPVRETISLDSSSAKGKKGLIIQSHYPPVPVPGDFILDRKDAPEGEAVVRLMYDMDSLSLRDSITVHEIGAAYSSRLKEENLGIGFSVQKLDSVELDAPNAVTIGFSKPTTYNLTLNDTLGYMLGKLKLPILFSFILVGITIASFVLLYRNMLKQQRLAELKNEFISNITHELKTPIATVGVAIEALRNFNAIDDPRRTREYLDISQNELQRLNLLVDKVLKLSMFEKKEVELKYEAVNLKEVVDEVLASMRLQIEKFHAQVTVRNEGDTTLQADRLHLLSVVFNLLDNALKYSKDRPEIKIEIKEEDQHVVFRMTDNGIGIPLEYREKVFEKFFRVPHGDTHNAKGYGLGLSYAAHVIRKHKGSIELKPGVETGADFLIILPKDARLNAAI